MTSLDIEQTSTATQEQKEKTIGRVKWFNNKNGYGFITITNSADSSKDMFVHHSGIVVSSEQYKYLVQGEYVEFFVEKTTNNKDHEFQAVNVTGIQGGILMCETRNEMLQVRNSYKSSNKLVREPDDNAEEETSSTWKLVNKKSADSFPPSRAEPKQRKIRQNKEKV
jgi:cold shock CspA family protein